MAGEAPATVSRVVVLVGFVKAENRPSGDGGSVAVGRIGARRETGVVAKSVVNLGARLETRSGAAADLLISAVASTHI